MPGDLPCQELPHDHAKTVDITAEGVAPAGQNLRCKPAGVAGCHAAQNGRLLHDSRQVEVTDLHMYMHVGVCHANEHSNQEDCLLYIAVPRASHQLQGCVT